MAEIKAPVNSGKYIGADLIIAEGDKTYDTQGISDKYSTGLSDLDEYFSGGFGKKNSYELVVVASAPKNMKTTLAMQMLAKQIENKVPMYWMLAEMSYGETINSLRAFYYPDIEKADKYFREAIECGSLMIADKNTMDNMGDYHEILHEIMLAKSKGAELFYIDPLNYLLKQTSETQQTMNMNESKFTSELKRFLEKTETTALIVLHNTKDPTSHRAMGLAGSADYPRMATKVIETRVEKKYNYGTSMMGSGETGVYLSIELWSARGIEQHNYRPMVVKAVFNPGHKGVKLEQLGEDDYRDAPSLLNENASDKKLRELWWVQKELRERYNG